MQRIGHAECGSTQAVSEGMQRRILIVDEHLANREIHTDVRQSEAFKAQIETALGFETA